MRLCEMVVLLCGVFAGALLACSSSSTAGGAADSGAADTGVQDAASEGDSGTEGGCPFTVTTDAGVSGTCSLGDAGASDGGAACALSCASTFAGPIALTPSSTDATCASLTMIDSSSCKLTPSDTCVGTAVCSSSNATEPSCKVTTVFDFRVVGTKASGQFSAFVLGSDNAYHGCLYDFTVTVTN